MLSMEKKHILTLFLRENHFGNQVQHLLDGRLN